MTQRTSRLDLLQANLEGDFELYFGIAMPVPRWPSGDRLILGDGVIFHLVYQDAWRRSRRPAGGRWAWLHRRTSSIRMPAPACAALCLGQLSPGIPPKELIFLGYYLVSLQDYTLDERDPHGVLNLAACEFYRCHPQYLPLTRAGLFDPWSPAGGET